MRVYEKSLHRRKLEKYLEHVLPGLTGRVLDAGSKNRRYDRLFNAAEMVVAVDKYPEVGYRVIPADVCKLPFASGTFDSVVCIEVLEYVPNYEKGLDEFQRVLKAGGRLVLSVPFMIPVHGTGSSGSLDTDYVRLTVKGWQECLSKIFSQVDIKPVGGRWTIIADCLISWIKEKGGIVSLFLYVPVVILSFATRLDERFGNSRFVSGYFIQCAK